MHYFQYIIRTIYYISLNQYLISLQIIIKEIHVCAVCVKQAVPQAICKGFVDKICMLVSPSIVINVEDVSKGARKAGKGQEEEI